MTRPANYLEYSRRGFLTLAGAGLYMLSNAETRASRTGEITARQVIERIQKNVGVQWLKETVDTFKIGNPDTLVKGIATSFSGTLDLCQRAHAAGKNLIIVHEPTFYNHTDDTANLNSEMFALKKNFIERNGLVIWRFHDHWHLRKPDGILTGMIEALGWEKYHHTEDPRFITLPVSSLETMAQNIQRQLKTRAMRVIGDPQTKVSRVILSPGFNNLQGMMRVLDRQDVDVLIIGEAREWEGIEYMRDVVTAGQKKGLIVLGHVPSEQGGMNECAKWLRTFVPEVPIEYMPGNEPFWTPKI